MRLGHLLDLPKNPDEGGAQTDNDAQEKQRQAWGCEHGEHSRSNASGVPANAVKGAASVQIHQGRWKSPDRADPQVYLTGPRSCQPRSAKNQLQT